jgi:hypothetical protein
MRYDGYGNIEDIHFILSDQMEKQIKGTFEYFQLDFVISVIGHQVFFALDSAFSK